MSAVIFWGRRRPYCAVITLSLQDSRFKTSTEVFPVGGFREHQGQTFGMK